MTLSVVCGVNWGDEGKGRMVDLLSEDADFVVRYQGGNNAGHTVRIRRRHWSTAPYRPLRRGCVALWRLSAGRHDARDHEA